MPRTFIRFALVLATVLAADVTLIMNLTWGEHYGRPWVLVNNNPIGPLLEATEGDTVTVHLINTLGDQPAMVHHHGLHQLNTSYFDGTPVSQPAVHAYHSFTYRFLASPPGTHMYHGHVGLLAADGLRGSIVVKPRVDVFSGWYGSEAVWMLSEFLALPAAISLGQLADGTYDSAGDEPFSDLRLDGVMLNAVMLDQCTMQLRSASKGTRIRLSNSGSHWALQLSIEGHWMVLLALDGHDVNPVRVDSVVLFPGERADILTAPIHSVQSAATQFDIQVETLNGRAAVGGVVAYAEWQGKPLSPPVGLQAIGPLDTSASATLNALGPHPATRDKVAPRADRSVRMRLGGDMMSYTWTMNGTRWHSPSEPLTGSLGWVAARSVPEGLIWRVRLGEVVEVVVVNPTMMAHSLHLHGHTFWVVGSGLGEKHSAGSWGAIVKDTVPVAAKGWLLIRVRFNNPGPWMFHCHNEMHLHRGMGGVFMVGNRQQQPVVPQGLFDALRTDPQSKGLVDTLLGVPSMLGPVASVSLLVVSIAVITGCVWFARRLGCTKEIEETDVEMSPLGVIWVNTDSPSPQHALPSDLAYDKRGFTTDDWNEALAAITTPRTSAMDQILVDEVEELPRNAQCTLVIDTDLTNQGMSTSRRLSPNLHLRSSPHPSPVIDDGYNL